jgi:hypothetical protein
MIRLFLGGAGLGLSFKLFLKADDTVTQGLALLFIPIFATYIYKAIEKIKQEQEK